MYFKAILNDDELFIEAADLEEAKHHLGRLSQTTGKNFPMDLVEWETLKDLPEGKMPMTFEGASKSGKPGTAKSLI